MSHNEPERHPTRAAIDSLAARFGLENHPLMQDWEYQVADAALIDPFLAYAEECHDDDESFVLMMMIFQSFDDLGDEALVDPRWIRVERLLKAQFALHRQTLRYWACEGERFDDFHDGEQAPEYWHITPLVRAVLASERGL